MDIDSPMQEERVGLTRSRTEEILPSPKRLKIESSGEQEDCGILAPDVTETEAKREEQKSAKSDYIIEDLLPHSRSLLPPAKLAERPAHQLNLTFESDVGIIEYVSSDVPPIRGIIKQRFTDFLVYEIDQQHNVLRLQNISKPDEPITPKPEENHAINPGAPIVTAFVSGGAAESDAGAESGAIAGVSDPSQTGSTAAGTSVTTEFTGASGSADDKPWPERFTSRLSLHLSLDAIEQLKQMFLEGPTPPLSSVGDPVECPAPTPIPIPTNSPSPAPALGNREIKYGERVGRGGRGGSGVRGRTTGRERPKPTHEDHRKVVSDVSKIFNMIPFRIASELGTIRELFEGRLESEVKPTQGGDAPRIVIRWNQRPSKNPSSNKPGRNPRDPSMPSMPSYIHFTMQKANRDTQDALAHISRMLKCPVKDLGVAGTKDKRGVTIQRVSLKRGKRTLGEVWKAVNNVPTRRTIDNAVTVRGERGVRIGDLLYRKAPLELGHLQGNSFIITLRNVKESEEVINRAMQSMKEKGFLNYYGMQRFGTSSIPTHSIGLALLKSDWRRALSLILRPRPGETPDAEAGRRAWLEERDLDKALQLMPRRMVAERCILEAYQKNFKSDSDMQNALHAIPKNLRTMYVHAYQSYVWNAIVSERIARYGFKPIVGDLVFDKAFSGKNKLNKQKEGNGSDENAESAPPNDLDLDQLEALEDRSHVDQSDPTKKHLTVKIKHLTEGNLPEYTIFDVIMPLPGFNVTYPGGELGEKYRAFMKLDGLDPDDMTRERKDYSLSGAYRKIMHLPKEVSWRILRYTDPEVPLAQTDEDKILGFDPPAPREDGQFVALQVEFHLGSAVYATMALREVTKAETSSHYQSVLTQAAEDQERRGSAEAVVGI